MHRIFASEGQEAFFEGHVHAFNVLGGVPAGKIRYDNLKSAVAQVLGFTRARVETDRWTAFHSHYGIEVFYCQPGRDGAHEKGGVEGEVGRFRRNHLVPVPEVASFVELNAMVEQWDQHDDARRIGARPRTVGEYFAAEQPLLNPLPDEPFATGRLLTPRVDRYAQITVRTVRYSVPVRLIGRPVRVLLGASELVVYDGRVEVARHERLSAKGGARVELDHYLEGLLRKPGALPGATAVDQARAAGRFTPVHDAWWESAVRKTHGDAAGTRALVGVLLLHRHLAHEFDFDANPSLDPATVHTLATCEWVRKGQPLYLIGDSGTGESHLLIALGAEAAMAGFRVRYVLAAKLVNELVEAADDRQLTKTIARYGRVDLICIDELGYMELDRRGAELLFQVLTEREEKNSVAIASNDSFGGWTKTFTDPRLCGAIVDRLTFGGNIIETGTDSYRLAHTRAQQAAARS